MSQGFEPIFLSDEFGGISHEEAMMADACSAITSQRINYVGNKKRLLPYIWGAFEESGLQLGRVTDAFGGSGVVSALFSYLGAKVAYNDILLSSCVQAVRLLSPFTPILDSKELTILMEDASGESACDITRRFYAGKFFTDDEAVFIDRYLGNVRLIYPQIRSNGIVFDHTGVNPDPKAIKAIEAYCAIIGHINSVCFLGGRYYNGQTLAKREHRLTHERNGGVELHKSFSKEILEKLPVVGYPKGSSSSVHNMDVVRFLTEAFPEGDLLYLDPPYGGESSDYAALYRFIEESVAWKRYDDDKEKIGNAVKFKGKNGYENLFKEVLSVASGYKMWMVSFNRTSFASMDRITSILEGFGRKVKVKSVPISYNYRKKRRNVSLGERIVAEDGNISRGRHIIGGTDDEIILLAERK